MFVSLMVEVISTFISNNAYLWFFVASSPPITDQALEISSCDELFISRNWLTQSFGRISPGVEAFFFMETLIQYWKCSTSRYSNYLTVDICDKGVFCTQIFRSSQLTRGVSIQENAYVTIVISRNKLRGRAERFIMNCFFNKTYTLATEKTKLPALTCRLSAVH